MYDKKHQNSIENRYISNRSIKECTRKKRSDTSGRSGSYIEVIESRWSSCFITFVLE